MLGWSIYYTRAAQVTQETAALIQQKNTSMRGAETQLDKLKKQITALDSVATPLISATNDRDFWPQILEDLNARLPQADIWITELAPTSGGKLLGAGEKRVRETATAPPVSGPAPKTAASSTKSIDGILVRGLYLYNAKQQEIVVDYLRNLASSPFFVIDPKTPERVIKSNSVPNDTEWAFPYELQLTLRKPVKLP
jgi:Tfp pilus assembly protein PilN